MYFLFFLAGCVLTVAVVRDFFGRRELGRGVLFHTVTFCAGLLYRTGVAAISCAPIAPPVTSQETSVPSNHVAPVHSASLVNACDNLRRRGCLEGLAGGCETRLEQRIASGDHATAARGCPFIRCW